MKAYNIQPWLLNTFFFLVKDILFIWKTVTQRKVYTHTAWRERGEGENESVFHHWLTANGCKSWAWARLKLKVEQPGYKPAPTWDPGTCKGRIWSLSRYARPLPLCSPGTLGWSWIESGAAGPWAGAIWDAAVAGGSFTVSATVLCSSFNSCLLPRANIRDWRESGSCSCLVGFSAWGAWARVFCALWSARLLGEVPSSSFRNSGILGLPFALLLIKQFLN